MSAENTGLPALPLARDVAADAMPVVRTPPRPRGRLFRKYVLFFVGLVAVALLVNGGFDFWFGYQENKDSLIRVQQEKADGAAQRIEEFVEGIERQIGWTTHAQWSAAPLDQRRFDYVRLLSQTPAITEISELDRDGKEQLKVSRLAMDVVGSGQDFSQTPAFTEARAHKVWFSPVYFRKESEPYMTLAMARAGRNAGVTVAEVNLKLIWDVITRLRIGQGGYAYVVDGKGKLIAHPDISLVLRDTDFTHLPQVAAALPQTPGTPAAVTAVSVARNNSDSSVLSAHASIAPLGWLVFVEVPLKEAFAPLYGAALRSAVLLGLGLAGATLVALFLARRMTGPIREMQEGAARIGAGDLDRRLDIHTGDELEALAHQFNNMAAGLQTSYAELEHKVEERTAELSEALDQQTATAEVLGVINSSPGDLKPVFDAMLERANGLCGAAFGTFMLRDGERFFAAALHGALPAPFATILRQGFEPSPSSPVGRLRTGEPFVHISDLAATLPSMPDDPVPRTAVEVGGVRTLLMVPLVKDRQLVGIFTNFRQEVRPFTDKQIALLQSFAAQAVIAMENARLLDEIRQRQAELRVTFDNMADGVAMFDENLHLAAWNRNFQEIVDLPDDFLAEPHDFESYIRYLVARGEFGASSQSRCRDDPAACPLPRALQLRAHPAGWQGDRSAAQPDAGGRVRADLQRHHRAQAQRGRNPRRPRRLRGGAARAEGGAGQPGPGRKDGLARSAHRRHRARNQEPAQLRQQFRQPVERAVDRAAGDRRAGPRDPRRGHPRRARRDDRDADRQSRQDRRARQARRQHRQEHAGAFARRQRRAAGGRSQCPDRGGAEPRLSWRARPRSKLQHHPGAGIRSRR